MKDFPKYKYHHTDEPIVVHTREQELALDDDWKDSPAEHGVITHPSAEQQAEMAVAAASKPVKSGKNVAPPTADPSTALRSAQDDSVVGGEAAGDVGAKPVSAAKPAGETKPKAAAKKKAAK